MTSQMGASPRARKTPKVLLVGWDAADWKVIHPLMDAGRMPFLQSVVERGVMGNLATLHPVLSPMLWTSIATGKRPYDHGILGFTEPTPDGSAVQPVSALSRTTKAIWNILNQQGYTSQVVGWWPSHPVEAIRGAMVSNQYHRAPGPPDQPWPLPPQSIHPATLETTLADLRVHPAELSAEEILPFVPQAHKVDQDQDRRLAGVMKTVAECVSVNNAATWLLENRDCDFFAVYFDAIDHFCHGFMKYHPPQQEWVSDEDFELYQHVVTTGYLLHDAMLGSLLRLAGPETTVILCSDHGFHPDHLRPRQIPHEPAGPAVEHRDYGVFLMAGPGIREDTLIHGTSLLDITPTILSIYDLPVGADMHGKVLVDAFDSPREVQSIPSWDQVEGEDARHDPALVTDPVANREALKQLVELGYVEELGEDRERAVERTARELRYNRARSFMDAGRYADARPALEALHAEEPSEYRYGIQLAMCLRALDEPGPLRLVVERISKQRKLDAITAREKLRDLAETLRKRTSEQEAENRAAPKGEGSDAAAEPSCSVHLVETSLRLRGMQEAVLAGLSAQVNWHAHISEVPAGATILVANEFFDALPVRQFERHGGAWYERVVEAGGSGDLTLGLSGSAVDLQACEIPECAEEGAVLETSPSRTDYAGAIAQRAMSASLYGLFIDYGHVRSAYGDTLQALRQHRYCSLTEAPGESDLTAHVDFEALGRDLSGNGADVFGPMPQRAFLKHLGIDVRAERLKSNTDPETRSDIDKALARLTDLDQMGDLFKVLACSSPALPEPYPFSREPA